MPRAVGLFLHREADIGESFDAIVTGVTPHGTFVRVREPHVEGLLAQRGSTGR
jgi:exoribonuclease R